MKNIKAIVLECEQNCSEVEGNVERTEMEEVIECLDNKTHGKIF